ncbi:hypothetical protein HAX54_030266, partial [Datura stramonium]|nr:hypothetical protein [Datura stramonium]
MNIPKGKMLKHPRHQNEVLKHMNDCCRPGARVTGEVMARHISDGGSNGRHLDDRPSLVPLRYGPFNLTAMELEMDRQMSDGPLWQPSPRLRFLG